MDEPQDFSLVIDELEDKIKEFEKELLGVVDTAAKARGFTYEILSEMESGVKLSLQFRAAIDYLSCGISSDQLLNMSPAEFERYQQRVKQ